MITHFSRHVNPLMVLAIMLIIAVYYGGCSMESPVSPGEVLRSPEGSSTMTAAKSKYPQSGSMTLSCNPYYLYSSQNNACIEEHFYYEGGSIDLPQGSYLTVESWALTAPLEMYGQDITVTMFADHDIESNRLFFEFGPSGCHFDPPVDVWIKWSDLGTGEKVILYFIEEETNAYIPLDAEQIDYQGCRLKMRVDHFSRYAVAFAN